jgi:hypothetical protein
MISKKLRRKFLQKISQTTTPTTTGTTPTTISSPPSFTASSVYPGISTGYNSGSLTIINNFVSLLNTALHYASNGQVNFQTLRNDNFNFDPSGATSVDQRNLMGIAARVYRSFLNSGQRFTKPLIGEQIAKMADLITFSPEFNNLSQVNPTGPLATKLQGNIKSLITNYMTYLKTTNPTQR